MNILLFIFKINSILFAFTIYFLSKNTISYEIAISYFISFNILILLSSVLKFYSRIKNIQLNKLNLENDSKFIFLSNKIKELSEKYNIKEPSFSVYESDDLNAFATGIRKNKAYIFISHNLYSYLDEKQLEAIICHEFAHIKNNDLLKQLIIESFFDSATFYIIKIFNGLNEIIKIPLIYITVNYFLNLSYILMNSIFNFFGLHISRKAEYKADEFSSKETGSSFQLIKSLSMISNISREFNFNHGLRNNFIKVQWGTDLFSTHPKTYKRIKRLEDFI